MKLRANHLTVSRMLLLPIPCYFLFGGRVEKMIALVAFTILALTDWLDGKLARKQGPTVLGGLLDPIADKMFLAFTWIPMALIEGINGTGVAMVPIWLVSLMFFRELSVTGMRGMAAAHGIEFKTATLAKFKTAFQMGGGGVIFWAVIWQDQPMVLIAGFVGLSLMPFGIALYRKIRGRGVGKKVWTQAIAYVCALMVSVFLSTKWVIDLAAYVIIGLTILSGLQYAQRVIEGLKREGWPAKFGEVALSFAESAIPIGIVALLVVPGVPVWGVIVMLTGELAAGGLCDLLATAKVRRRVWLAWLRCLAILACGVLGWLVAPFGLDENLTSWATMAAAGVSALYCGGLFIVHRPVYMR